MALAQVELTRLSLLKLMALVLTLHGLEAIHWMQSQARVQQLHSPQAMVQH